MGVSVTLSKSPEELRQLPLVELAWEILNAKREPYYFRDLMNEIQQLRGMTDAEVMDVIARLYTEINIDGRFICIGQNVWGLKRWYPVDKVADKTLSGKRFLRRSGDAFSDDDEEIDEEFEEEELTAEEDADEAVGLYGDGEAVDELEPVLDDVEEELELEADEAAFLDEDEGVDDQEVLLEDEPEDNSDDEDNHG
ncbi:MAG: DNA-directed RNA polymerase subunit delta [Alicyclobacillaceae bacterium]|nr:DNA-directed RNA polymerase subunit delta [Alicyclobacillaceae bacterium]